MTVMTVMMSDCLNYPRDTDDMSGVMSSMFAPAPISESRRKKYNQRVTRVTDLFIVNEGDTCRDKENVWTSNGLNYVSV